MPSDVDRAMVTGQLGSTLASVSSVRPRPRATVSKPLRWEQIVGRATTEDFRIDNVPGRGRATLDTFISGRRGA